MSAANGIDLARVLAAVDDISGDRQRSLAWLRAPLGEFEDLTPERLVEVGRADDLLAYIRSISSGFLG